MEQEPFVISIEALALCRRGLSSASLTVCPRPGPRLEMPYPSSSSLTPGSALRHQELSHSHFSQHPRNPIHSSAHQRPHTAASLRRVSYTLKVVACALGLRLGVGHLPHQLGEGCFLVRLAAAPMTWGCLQVGEVCLGRSLGSGAGG